MEASVADKRLELIRDLAQINEHLPARVYIPFVNESVRNYAVLHIAALESKVFQTKSRAPVLLCIEVYRPDELSEHLERQPSLRSDGVVTSKEMAAKKKSKSAVQVKNTMKQKLASILTAAKNKQSSNASSRDKVGLDVRSMRADRSDSDQIDRIAD